MLNLLDRVIEQVLNTDWGAPPKPTFFFTVPDDDWRAKVKAGTGERLNIYLYEVRENVQRRRAEWDEVLLPDRTAVSSRPPAYFDCHYLISVWSSVEDSEATTPMLDEHRTLGEALRVLMRNPDVNPAALGVVGGGPVFQDAHIYLSVAPPEVPRVLNDFWSTMKQPWRPGILLIATAPLDLLRDSAPAPLLTTFVQRYAILGGGSVEERIQIGGWVLRASDDTPITGATVRRVASGEQAQTDSQGRYSFTGLPPGIHRLRAEATGFTAIERDLDIPAGPPDDHIFKLS